MLRNQPPPLTTEALPPELHNPEAIRKRFLNHEASIQSIGSLYLLGCVILVVMGVAGLLGYREPDATMLMSAFFLVFGVAEGWIGWHLRKLDPRSKIGATVLAAIGLLAFPLGTLINAYVLYLLHSAKGKYVFSPEYRAVITDTPHIRYRISILIWIFLGIVIIGLLAAVIIPLINRH